jgi:hypothetical protein
VQVNAVVHDTDGIREDRRPGIVAAHIAADVRLGRATLWSRKVVLEN